MYALPTGYSYFAQTCVMGHNIRVYKHKTITQCSTMCNQQPACVAFEFGIDYGGSFQSPNDCNLNNGVDSTGCDNLANNFDLYVKTEAMTTTTMFNDTNGTTTTTSIRGWWVGGVESSTTTTTAGGAK